MKTIMHMAIPAVLAVLLPPPSDGHASSLPADSVHFCLPVDPEQRQNNAPQPAGKWASDLNVGEPRTVRLFYFLPNDRPYRTEVVDSMKAGILDLRTFFAGQMETHGHGNSTFRIETDEQGDPIVHRVDGDHADSHYSRRGYTEGEIARAFDNSKNIVLIVMDVSASSAHGRGTGAKDSGWAIIYGDWNWFAAAHELGHSFGLHHDFRDNEFIMSYGRADRSSAKMSACAAEFLSVHPYFNADVPLAIESPPTIELVSPTEYPAGSESLPVRLRVRDDVGLHQVLLFVKPQNPFLDSTPEVKACRGLAGETDAIVEFDYDGITPSDMVGTAPEAHTSLSNTPRHKIYVVAVDTNGNRTSTYSPISFDLMETSPYDLATLSHGGEIFSVVFSPDGTVLALGSGYNSVGLWDVATRTNTAGLTGHTGSVYSVSFSPDGTTLASGSGDNTVKLWDAATRTNTATLSGHTDLVRTVSFSPDGTTLASGSGDNTVKLWDVAGSTNTATLSGHADLVRTVSFSPDGTTLASGSVDKTVKLWDVANKTNTATLESRSWVYSVSFSPDGTTLAAASGKTIELWDVATKEKTATLYPLTYDESITSVSYSPDGAVLALGSGYNTVELWDVATREKIVHFSGHTRGVYSVDFSPDGKMLASSAWDGKVRLWDTSEWTASIAPVGQRTSQVREAILGVVRLNDPNVSNFAQITATHLDGITALYLNDRGITSLKSGDFDGLTSLEELRLFSNQLTSLPEDIFSRLSSLQTLRFGLNQLTTLPSGLLDGLTALTDLRMIGNRLTALPDSIFAGLTGLTRLSLGGNAVDPLPLNVSMKKTGEGQFKAVAPTGAPFDIVLPLTISNGTVNGGAVRITIPAGSVESDTLSITRTPGTTFAATVDIGTLPGLPVNHSGYALVKSAGLPLAVTDGPVVTEIWSGRITVAVAGDNRGYFGRNLRIASAPFGTISDGDFVHKGVTYRIGWITTWNGYEKSLTIGIVGSDAISGCDLRHWTLHVEGLDAGFVFSDAEYYDGWTLSSLSSYSFLPSSDRFPVWNANDQIDLRLTYTDRLAPDAPSVAAINEGNRVKLSWIIPCDGGSEISGFEYRKRMKNGAFGPWTSISSSAPNQANATGYTTDDLNNAAEYLFEVRAVNELGAGKVSREINVVAPPLPVCSRTPQVRDAIVGAVAVNNCNDVTPAHLVEINALRLASGGITTLKDGDFSGLTGLAVLRLGSNPGSPFSLTVTLEKVGVDQFKAIAPNGAPFDIVLPLSVTNGSINGGATTITIPRGSVESQPLTVTRTSGTTASVTVDIGTLPALPNGHFGYALVKSSDLPLEIFGSGVTGGQASTDFNGDGRTDFVDFFLFADAYGSTNAKFDLDGNGTVDFADFFRFVDAFGA